MKKLWRIIAFPILVGVVVFALTVAKHKTSIGQSFPIETQKYNYVLTLWNIDTFEGGVGSRGDFLSSVALKFGENGSPILVINHTVESAKNTIKKGKVPDMISFGVGADFVAQYAIPLDKISYLGGENGGKIYAYPWCFGGYFLVSKKIDNQPINRLIVSQNEFNLSYGAIYYSEIKANIVEYYSPLTAYTKYLADNNSTFLCTQRDIWRLVKRGESFESKPLEEFSDITQYISVTTKDRLRAEECKKFISRLLSQEIQEKMVKIGMFPIGDNPYGESLGVYDKSKTLYTVSPFVSTDYLKEVIEGTNQQNITNNSLLKFKNAVKRL